MQRRVDPATIATIAETLGLSKLDAGILDLVSREAEMRLRELVQDARKFASHAHRRKLLTSDVDAALRLRNTDGLYGYSSADPIVFQKVSDGVGPSSASSLSGGASSSAAAAAAALGEREAIWFVEDRVLTIDSILKEPLPRPPADPTFSLHWLAIEGEQPVVPENPHPANAAAFLQADSASSSSTAPSAAKAEAKAKSGPQQQVKPVVEHVLSREQQMYFEHVTASVLSANPALRRTALASLSSDAGIDQLVPYFVQYIAVEVLQNMRKLHKLTALMHMAHALLASPYISIEPYLHQLLPSILTCLVGKRLCHTPNENHWALRDFAATLVARVCADFGPLYPNLKLRVTKTLASALLDPKKPLTTHYGAIVGLSGLGQQTTRLLILPHLADYLELLDHTLSNGNANPTRVMEGRYVRGALLHATGMVVRHEMSLLNAESQPQAKPKPKPKPKPRRKRPKRGKEEAHESDSDEDMGGVSDPDGDDSMRDAAASTSRKRKMGAAHLPPGAVLVGEGLPLSFDQLYDLFGESLLPYFNSPATTSHNNLIATV